VELERFQQTDGTNDAILFGSLFDFHTLAAKKAATAVRMLAKQRQDFELLDTAIARFRLSSLEH
jgi:hypothetical protein